MKTLLRLGAPAVLIAVLLAGAALSPGSASGVPSVGNPVLQRALDIELGKAQPGPKEISISGGVMGTLLERTGVLARRAASAGLRAPTSGDSVLANGCQNTFTGNGQTNVRANQDCSLRLQAGETLAINPTNELNMIAGQNDSRIGYSHCGYDWTVDGGNHWGDQTPPFFQFTLLSDRTAEACSDPTATFDSHGNAYVGGVLFDVHSSASAIVVARSNAGINGAFFHSPDPVGGFQEYRATPLGVVASDDTDLNDKPLIVADAGAASAKRDNVYATWTRFKGGISPIHFSQSTNGGATWSPLVEISGESATSCGGPCNLDQGSKPSVGPDGTIYVTFGNANTPTEDGQVLFVKCPAAADCSSAASWTAPVRVGALVGGLPTGPSSTTGCPSGQRCIPPNGYRQSVYMTVSSSVDSNGRVFVVWADFRNNTNAACTGSAETAMPPCDNDVFYSFSTDGGATWSAPRNVTPRARFGETAQWQPWSAVTADGAQLWVGYYDRQYGNCETTGCNDITATLVTSPASESPTYTDHRVSTGSMPNLVVANNPIQAGFLGDYMWVTTDSQGRAHLVWADTRPRVEGAAPEGDIYYARVPPLADP